MMRIAELRARLRALVERFPGLTTPKAQARSAAWLEGETLRVRASRETIDGLETLVECEGYRSREDAAETVLEEGVKDATAYLPADRQGGRHA